MEKHPGLGVLISLFITLLVFDPSSLILTRVTAAPTLQPAALTVSQCGPFYTTTMSQCLTRAAACKAQFGIILKWTGPGTTGKNGLPLGDGGCQCDQYCGYLSVTPCKHDPQCIFATKHKRCYNKKSMTPGHPILVCPVPATGKPSAAETSAPVSKVPAFQPSVSPSRAPTTSKPSKNPTISHSPTKSPTTSRPSKNPTTSRPTENPTTSSPSHAPTHSPTTSRPSRTPSHAPGEDER